MNELSVINKALNLPAIKDQREEDLYKPFVLIIGKVHALRGQSIETEDLRFMAREFSRSIYERFPGLTIEEVSIALDKGVKKDFGEYFGLNVITFLDWVKAYQNSEARQKVLEEKRRAELPEKAAPTKEEIERMQIRNALASFEGYRQNKMLRGWIVFTARTYDFLDQRGVIRMTPAEKWNAVAKAKELIEKEVRNEYKKKSRLRVVSDVVENIIARDCKDDSSRVIYTAKSITLEWFFDKLIQEKKDLKTLLSQ